MNGSYSLFISVALNSEVVETQQQMIARYFMWHLTIFSIFSFKLRKLPKKLAWVAYLNLVCLLATVWTGFQSSDGHYHDTWRLAAPPAFIGKALKGRQYSHWAAA